MEGKRKGKMPAGKQMVAPFIGLFVGSVMSHPTIWSSFVLENEECYTKMRYTRSQRERERFAPQKRPRETFIHEVCKSWRETSYPLCTVTVCVYTVWCSHKS